MLGELLVNFQGNFWEWGSRVIPIILRDYARIAQVLLILHTEVVPLHLWVDTTDIELGCKAVHVGVRHLSVEPAELVGLWLILMVLKFRRVKFVAPPELIFRLLAIWSARRALWVCSRLCLGFLNLMLMMCSEMGPKRWCLRWRVNKRRLGKKWIQGLLLLIHCHNVSHQIRVIEDRQDIWLRCLNWHCLRFLDYRSWTFLDLVIEGSHIRWKIFHRIEITVIFGKHLSFGDIFLRWARSYLCECRILCRIISCSFHPLIKGDVVQLLRLLLCCGRNCRCWHVSLYLYDYINY